MTIQSAAEAGAHPARRPGTTPSEGFEEFVRATGRGTYRSALLLCGDHQLAEDLTQATYTKVYVAWKRVSSVDNPVAYTRTVLVRTFLSQRRRRRVSEWPVAELPEIPASGPDTDARLELLSAVRLLPPIDRTVLVLRYWEDLSVTDTAELLGIRESACRTRTSRALARLRILLPQLPEADHDTDEEPS